LDQETFLGKFGEAEKCSGEGGLKRSLTGIWLEGGGEQKISVGGEKLGKEPDK